MNVAIRMPEQAALSLHQVPLNEFNALATKFRKQPIEIQIDTGEKYKTFDLQIGSVRVNVYSVAL